MPSYHFMQWDDTIDARLIHLIFRDALSYEQAARILQDEFRMACSRNSCIGRIARLRAKGKVTQLPFKASHPKSLPVEMELKVKVEVNRRSAPDIKLREIEKVSVETKFRPHVKRQRRPQAPITLLVHVDPVPMEHPKVILDIPTSRYECRWIDGEGAERRWCCAQTAFRKRNGETHSMPYCAAHAQRCYR